MFKKSKNKQKSSKNGKEIRMKWNILSMFKKRLSKMIRVERFIFHFLYNRDL